MSDSEKSFLEKLNEIKTKILKSEFVRIGFPIFFGILLILFLLPFFFNNSALKFQISQKVSQTLGADLTILGDVDVAFLPSPSITLNEVLLRNYSANKTPDRDNKIQNIYAKKIHIKLALFKASQGLAIKKIIFSDAILQSYHANNQTTIRSDKFSELTAQILENPPKNETKTTSGITTKLFSIGEISPNLNVENLPIIVIKNGLGFFYDKFNKRNETSSLSAELKFSSKKIIASGSFISGGVVSNFKSQIRFNSNSKKPDSFFELVSPSTEMRITGNFLSENKGILDSIFKGKIEGEILEFKSFYKSYVSNNGGFADKLKLNSKPIKISANISSNDGLIEIDDLVINSSLVNGEGEIDLDLSNDIPAIDTHLDLSTLDLNSFLSDEVLAISYNESTLDDKFKSLGNDVAESLPATKTDEVLDGQKSQIVTEEKTPKLELVKNLRDFDLNAEIKINNIALFSGEIKDASLYLTISKEGEILVAPALFTIPGNGAFRAWGVVDNSGSLPKFIGKFDLTGKSLEDVFRWLKIESQSLKFGNLKEYKVYSDILLTPNLSKLGNFYLSLNSDSSEFLGEITIDNSDKIPNIKSRFRGNRFDVDDYFFTSNNSVYFSPGLLVKKLLWLNDITSSADLDLTFDKMIYGGEEFSNQKLRLKFGRGYIQIDNLELQSPLTELKADMLVDISEKSPQFTLNVNANNFHYEEVKESEEYLSKSSSPDIIDRFFDLPSLDSFNGNINLNFANFNLNNRPIKNLKFQGRLISGNIKNSVLSSEVYGGTFDYTGVIGLGLNKIISGNITIKQALLQDLLSDFLGVNNLSGIANISASINSSAAKKGAFKENLNSEIKFNVNTPSIKGYGLDNLVKKMFAPQQNTNDLREPEKVILDSEAVTLFKKSAGSVKITNGVGKLSANISGSLVNAVLTGSVDIPKNNTNLLFNAIFLTGTRKKPVPINIASNIGGNFNSLNQSLNIDQVRQYFGLEKLITPKNTSKDPSELPMPDDLKSQIIQPNFDQ